MKEPMLLVAVKDEGAAVMQLNVLISRWEGTLDETLLLRALDGAMMPPGIQELDYNSFIKYRKIVQDTFTALKQHENVSREDFINTMNLNFLALAGERSVQAAEERLSKNAPEKDSKVVEPSWSEDDSDESVELERPTEHNIFDTLGEVHVDEPTEDLGGKLEKFEMQLELYVLKPKDPASESELISAAAEYILGENDREMALVRVLTRIHHDVGSEDRVNLLSSEISKRVQNKGEFETRSIVPTAFQNPISLLSISIAADQYFSNSPRFEKELPKMGAVRASIENARMEKRATFSDRSRIVQAQNRSLKEIVEKDSAKSRATLISKAILYISLLPAKDQAEGLLKIEKVLNAALKEKPSRTARESRGVGKVREAMYFVQERTMSDIMQKIKLGLPREESKSAPDESASFKKK